MPPNQYTQTTTTGFGSRIGGSIGGVFIGLLLFVGSFALLYWNEGRIDLSLLAQTATPVPAQTVASDQGGKLVSITGPITSSSLIGDSLFLLPGAFVGVHRSVQVYGWTEHKTSQIHNNVGGSQTTQTTESYSMGWTSSMPNSSNFQYPDGHINPQQTIFSEDFTATSVAIGAYSIDSSIQLPYPQKLTLTNAMLLPTKQKSTLLNGDTLYIPASATGTPQNPQIGDTEISYMVLPNQSIVSVFGKLNGSTIAPYYDNKSTELFFAFAGSRDEAIHSLHQSYTTMTWVFRGAGFAMMWFGLMMILGPILALLSILPILEDIGGAIVGLAAFLVALVLTIVTIVVSMIAHNLIALLVALALALALAIALLILLAFHLHRRKMSNVSPAS